MGALVSVDTGGTHTDIVLIDRAKSALYVRKVPTTPARLSEGVLDGIRTALADTGLAFSDIDRLVYGTTLVTNIIVERDTVPVALITTENFRDVLAMGRAYRTENIYDLLWRPEPPLVPRSLRFGVTERIDSQGKVLAELDEASVRRVLAEIDARGIETVAVCLLHSYANPAHEERIAQIASAEYPHLRLSVSNQILREFREYERTSTTVANAFVMRPIEQHLTDLGDDLSAFGLVGAPYIMRANGGVMGFDTAKETPVALTHSGPMGGIIGAAIIAKTEGLDELITLDMGGTSTDVSLISGGSPRKTSNSVVAGLPVNLPSLELVTVGAGGGSIAWVDDAGALKVGPRSAGAEPGPACYGKGGTQPTITDANLFLNRLNPDWFLAGAGDLHRDLSEKALGRLAAELGIGVPEAAAGILAIGESHMVNAIKLASIKQGIDPRKSTLVGFGGAGPLHTLMLAHELRISRAIIPCAPGNMSALGMLSADLNHDFVRSLVKDVSALQANELAEHLQALSESGRAWLQTQDVEEQERMLIPSVDVRYRGQSHELSLPLNSANDLEALADAFRSRHHQVYGYSIPDEAVQITNLRLSAVGKLMPGTWERRIDPDMAGCRGTRKICLDPSVGAVTAEVWRADGLRPSDTINGPAVIEFSGSTCIVPPGWRVRCDALGHLHCEVMQ